MPNSKILEIYSLLNILTDNLAFEKNENDQLDVDVVLQKLKILKKQSVDQTIIIQQLELANKEIIEQKKRLDKAQNIAKIGSWEYNTITNETSWSKELYNIFEIKYNDDNFVDSFKSKIHSEDLKIFDSLFQFDPKESFHIKNFRIICNNNVKHIHATLFSKFEKGIISQTLGTFQDITVQKLALEKEKAIEQIEIQHKRKLIEAILFTKEKEQKRIAQELHDDIGSSLMVLKIAIHQMNLKESEKLILFDSISELVGKVRNLSNELSPNILEEFGLISALKHLVNTISSLAKINISFQSNKDILDQISKEEEISIYRIIQELINNILKYASAKIIKIKLQINENSLSIKIIDDGNSFIPKANHRSKTTLGLLNIESRIEYINASINFKKNDPTGTIVHIVKTL